jgi:hypothetical protein
MSSPTCLLSHSAMSSSCELYELLYTWTLCMRLHVIQPRINFYSSFVVINNFHPWHGAHVVDVDVLSSSHLYDEWLINYSLPTKNQSPIRLTLPCADWINICWVFHWVVMLCHVSACLACTSPISSHLCVLMHKWLQFHNYSHFCLLRRARLLLNTHGASHLHNKIASCLQKWLHCNYILSRYAGVGGRTLSVRFHPFRCGWKYLSCGKWGS